jgi:hypothetical protein
MSALRFGLLRWRLPAAGCALGIVFAVLAGRFWHPYYGFTKFVQLDEADQKSAIHEIRDHPVFAYRGFNGYDGAAYTQLAFHPLLDSVELKPALDNLPYRARRILGSALAWLLAGGQPGRIAPTYAALNLGVWLVLATLLWRVLPVTDARSWAAWAGVLFSAGALHSVRLALTDLLAATLVTAAVWQGERGRARGALGLLATAALARETALAAVVALWRGPSTASRAWLRNLVRTGVVTLPLLAWMGYVRWQAGPADQGFGNFTWPVVAWIQKWSETLAAYGHHPEFRGLITTTLLATIGLTVQAAYLIHRPRWSEGWWRAGLAGVAMMVFLGTAVWEGHPGAATRVLLPMSVAFAVLAVRERAGWGWIVAGSLTVGSGVISLWEVPQDPRELAAGRFTGGAYVAQIDAGWYGLERRGRAAWAWTANHGTLLIETSPQATAPLCVRLKVRAITPRALEVRQGATMLFSGNVTPQSNWIELSPVSPSGPGRLRLELSSSLPPTRESEQPGARALGFALHGVEVR